jgi:hypothetical protein
MLSLFMDCYTLMHSYLPHLMLRLILYNSMVFGQLYSCKTILSVVKLKHMIVREKNRACLDKK